MWSLWMCFKGPGYDTTSHVLPALLTSLPDPFLWFFCEKEREEEEVKEYYCLVEQTSTFSVELILHSVSIQKIGFVKFPL